MRRTANTAAATQPTTRKPTTATTSSVATLGSPRRPERRSGARPAAATGVGFRTRQISHVAGDRPWGQRAAVTYLHGGANIGGMSEARTFQFRYGVFRPLLSVLAAGPAFSRVTVDGDRVRVRMGFAFRADIPRKSIRSARPWSGFVTGIGVHGWRGRWLVNGAARGIVRLEIDPGARAYVLGVPVRLRDLAVSVTEPEELIAAVG